MRLGVPNEVSLVVKGTATNLTAVRWRQTRLFTFVPDVGPVFGLVAPAVSLQLDALAEAFPTDFAGECRLTFVTFRVSLQRSRGVELLVANTALERRLGRVDSHVRHHVSFLVEASSADVAAEWFFPGVKTQVCLLSSN